MLPIITDAVANMLGSGIGSAISGIASLFGADAQSRNVRSTNEANMRMAREANDLQWRMAQANNQLQTDLMRENNAFNKQSAIDMLMLEYELNSPANQRRRLLEGGYNPATMYGSGATMGQSDASTPSAASSGISPSMPQFQLPNLQAPPSVLNTMFSNIESLSRTFGNLAKSGLDIMQKKRISTLLGKEYDKLISEIENIDIQNQWNQFKFALDKENLDKKQKAEISKLFSDIFNAYAQGGAAHASIAVKNWEAKLSQQSYDFNEKQNPIILNILLEIFKFFTTQSILSFLKCFIKCSR